MTRRRREGIPIPQSLRDTRAYGVGPGPVARYVASHSKEPVIAPPVNQMRTGVSDDAERVSAARGSAYLEHTDQMDRASHNAQLQAELARQQLENKKEYYRFQRRAGGAGAARRRRELRIARRELLELQQLATEGGKRTKNKEVELTNAANRAKALMESYPELAQMGVTSPDTWLIGKETRQQIGQEGAAASYAQKASMEMLKQQSKGDPRVAAVAKIVASPTFNMFPKSMRQKLMTALNEGLEATKASGGAKGKDYRNQKVGDTIEQQGRTFVITMKDGKKFPKPL